MGHVVPIHDEMTYRGFLLLKQRINRTDGQGNGVSKTSRASYIIGIVYIVSPCLAKYLTLISSVLLNEGWLAACKQTNVIPFKIQIFPVDCRIFCRL